MTGCDHCGGLVYYDPAEEAHICRICGRWFYKSPPNPLREPTGHHYGGNRGRYTEEQRVEALRRVRAGESQQHVARYIGCNASTIQRWLVNAREG